MFELFDRVQARFVAGDRTVQFGELSLQRNDPVRIRLHLYVKRRYRRGTSFEIAFERGELALTGHKPLARGRDVAFDAPPRIAQPSELVAEARDLAVGARNRCTAFGFARELFGCSGFECAQRVEGGVKCRARLRKRRGNADLDRTFFVARGP